ncbi:DNA repair exonuclease [Sporosarcina sp. P12(2017)]|uniref:metallophosphoesterase family protein n=1 Tax=unclassified Sporosarcina TaxID=2647733 RepID=UPI000C167BFC|nr:MULTISPECIES: DNA repair exonuclease [unclassified Sporosarcina]PIC56523.1 DNA repair exonuclease [Sporosarcina sp. P10]PIC60174.1 DNA repair exonuclease [Sporosarcina sp. P12(2017)]
MEPIRFLHTADLHLDSPFKGMASAGPDELARLQQSTFAAFDRFIAYAVKERPDFIVIVGDLYDGEDRSLRAQIRFQQGMQQLQKVNIPVYLSYGNHDHLAGRWTRVSLPENVHVFSEQVEQKQLMIRDEIIYLHGFSYPQRHVKESMIRQYPKASEGIHIGLLHGSVAGDAEHAVYAPFTIDELQNKHYRYWALGHIHKRQVLSQEPPIVYPGNIQGRHRNEQGLKGFYDVSLTPINDSMKFVATSDVVFTTLTVSCKGIEYADDWISACQEAIDQLTAETGSVVVELVMEHTEGLTKDLARAEAEWLDILREQYEAMEPFVWISAIEWPKISYSVVPNSLLEPVEKTISSWEADDWNDLAKVVYNHKAGRYLEALTSADFERLKQQATALLENEMMKEG